LTVAEGEVEEGKKGGKKKMIMMIVVFLLIALIAAKMTVLKPPPLTKAQQAAKDAADSYTLSVKCALANGLDVPKAPPDVKGAAATPDTAAPARGEVLVLDSITVNLADGHFLKFGLGIQFVPGVVADTVKTTNPGAHALNYVLEQLKTKSQGDLGPKSLGPLQSQLGYKICTDGPKQDDLNDEGKILGIYFTDFVWQ
jgi:flagellar FliL protein